MVARAEPVVEAEHYDYDLRTKLNVYNTGDLRYWPSVPNATDYDDTQPVDLFERGKPLFTEQRYTWSLDCESGQAARNCNNAARPVCDAYCQHQCREHCSEAMDQSAMSACLAANDAVDCAYNINEYLWLPTRICRTLVLFDSSEKDFKGFNGTIYIAEPDWDSVSLANFKRLKKAVLTIPMANEWDFSYTQNDDDPSMGSVRLPKDMGNMFHLADGHDVTTCAYDRLKLPFTIASLQNHDVFRSDFGPMYHKMVGGVGEAPFTYENDITKLLNARSLQLLGGLPKQFIIWWSGVQPDLYARNPPGPEIKLPDGQYSEDAVLKVMYQFPPARYFSSGGFQTLTMDSSHHLRTARTAMVAAFFMTFVALS